jgi:hypothetical protein
MRVRTVPLLLLTVVPMPLTAAANNPAKNEQPLSAKPVLVGTQYCYGDSEVYSVWLKLRVKYTNRTEKTLILDKEIGKAWFGVEVARNLDELAAGNYEYHPNIDWFYSKDNLPVRPSPASPGRDFEVLVPGGRYEGEIDTFVVAQYENPKSFAGSLKPGVHFLQMELAAWNHLGKPSEFARAWRKFGELVTGVIKTEPLEIRIPLNPKVERNCQ